MLRKLFVLVLATWLVINCFERSMEGGSTGRVRTLSPASGKRYPSPPAALVDTDVHWSDPADLARSLNNRGVLGLLYGLSQDDGGGGGRWATDAQQQFDLAIDVRSGDEPADRAGRAIYMLNKAEALRQLGDHRSAQTLEQEAAGMLR